MCFRLVSCEVPMDDICTVSNKYNIPQESTAVSMEDISSESEGEGKSK